MHNVRQLLLFTGDGAGSCSMSCRYCFIAKQGPLRVMGPETLRDAMTFLETLTDEPGLHFFGTEPTMQWDLIIEARRLRPSWPISLTTNGLLLTPERIDWMAEHDVKVYVYSIDGAPEHHIHRRDTRGRETWDIVAEHLRYLVQSQGDWVTARATWTPDDCDLVGRFRALEALGARSIQVVPDIEVGVTWDEKRVEQAYLELGEHYGWKRTPVALLMSWWMQLREGNRSQDTRATSGAVTGQSCPMESCAPANAGSGSAASTRGSQMRLLSMRAPCAGKR